MYQKVLFFIFGINVVLLLLAHASQIWLILQTNPHIPQLELSVWQTMKPYLWLSFALITWQRISQFLFTAVFSRIFRNWDRFQNYYTNNFGSVINMQNETVASIVYYLTFLFPYCAISDPMSWMSVSSAFTGFLHKAWWAAFVIVIARIMGERRFAAIIILSAVLLIPMLYELFGAPYVFLFKSERFSFTGEYAQVLKLFIKYNFPTDRVLLVPGSKSAYVLGTSSSNAVMLIGDRLRTMGLSARHFEAFVAQAFMKGGQFYHITESIMDYALNVTKIVLLFCVINRPGFYKSFGFTHSSKAVPFGVGMILLDLFSIQLGILLAPLWNYLNWYDTIVADHRTFFSGAGYGPANYEAIYEVAKQTNFANAPLMTTLFGLFSSHEALFYDRMMELGPCLGE